MNTSTFHEKLALFKENEQPEVVLLLADKPQLVKIVVAWGNIKVGPKETLGEPPDGTAHAVWDWLWESADYSAEDLMQKSGVSTYGFDKKLGILIGNRILYPDGTVNSFVQRWLREKVLKLFDTKEKAKKK